MKQKKIEPLMNTDFPALDAIFNKGWEDFVTEIRDNNERCNYRLLRLVEKIKGELFVSDLKILLKRVDYGMLHIVRKPEGLCLRDNRFPTINQIWVNQKNVGGINRGSISVQIKENRYLIAYYAQ